MSAVKLLDLNHRQRLDRYELVGELASGGMATVFLGRIGGVGGFQRFVAIKRLHPHLASEQEFVEMFVDEARLAASIHHPNVVPILDIGASDHGYYLVMEYVEGDTLARLLARAASKGERLPMPIALRVILDTLAGLHAAHELRDENDALLGLVHRDVSPQNILVGIDGTSRITDFGVAHASSRLSTTRGGQLKGKLAYMAPEQARGQGVDRRADVFAMGTVLWEVLAGRRLFKADSDAETLNRVLFEGIPRIREIDPGLPSALDAVAARALEREPEQRYATCAELSDALERAARATRLVASARDVASYVKETIGDDIQQQREAVRAWLAVNEPSRAIHTDAIVPPPLFALSPDATHPGSSVSSTAITIRHGGREHADGSSSQPAPAARSFGERRGVIIGSTAGGVLLLTLGLWAISSRTGAPPPPVQEPAAAGLRAQAPEPAPSAATTPVASAAPTAPPDEVVEPPTPAALDIDLTDEAPADPAPAPAPSAPAHTGATPPKKNASPRPPRPAAPAPGDDFLSNPYR